MANEPQPSQTVQEALAEFTGDETPDIYAYLEDDNVSELLETGSVSIQLDFSTTLEIVCSAKLVSEST